MADRTASPSPPRAVAAGRRVTTRVGSLSHPEAATAMEPCNTASRAIVEQVPAQEKLPLEARRTLLRSRVRIVHTRFHLRASHLTRMGVREASAFQPIAAAVGPQVMIRVGFPVQRKAAAAMGLSPTMWRVTAAQAAGPGTSQQAARRIW